MNEPYDAVPEDAVLAETEPAGEDTLAPGKHAGAPDEHAVAPGEDAVALAEDAVAPVEETVEGMPVLAEARPVAVVASALPAVQAAAVAATGFVAGAATLALVRRHSARKLARSRAVPRRAVDMLPIVGSRTFIVDVHMLAKPGE